MKRRPIAGARSSRDAVEGPGLSVTGKIKRNEAITLLAEGGTDPRKAFGVIEPAMERDYEFAARLAPSERTPLKTGRLEGQLARIRFR
jgi:hypothetical protein